MALEFSFILIKPGVNSDCIKNKVRSLLKLLGMTVLNERILILKEEHVIRLWPYVVHDPIMLALFVEQYAGKEFCFFWVTGNNAIENTTRIKRFVREYFAVNAIDNCLHSPADADEYSSSMRLFSTERVDFSSVDSFLIKPLFADEYSIKAEEVKCAAKRILTYLQHPVTCLGNDPYQLELCDCDDFWVGDFALLLRKAMPQIPLWKSYAVCLSLTYRRNQVPVMTAATMKEAEYWKNKLAQYGLTSVVKDMRGDTVANMPIQDMFYEPSVLSAQIYNTVGRLDVWVYLFLARDANAMCIAEEMKRNNYCFVGPVDVPLYLFSRKCGWEPDMPYQEERDLFEKKTEGYREKYSCGVDMPPILLVYDDESGFDLYDGAHRYEALKRIGRQTAPTIIAYKSEIDLISFREIIMKYGDVHIETEK